MQVDTTSSLRAQIQSLTELYNNAQTLRHIPPLLLRPPISNGLSLPTQSLRTEFQHVKDLGDAIRSHPVQEALRSARDSLKKDGGDLGSNTRRENRKRRRPPSPESPQPYIALERKSSSLFPVMDDSVLPLRSSGLSDYIRVFNHTNKSKLHLWSRTRAVTQTDQTVIVRFTIPDVLTAYIMLAQTPTDPPSAALIAESLTTFAPRERKAPHSQSDFIVYQSLSQQIAKMLQSHPRVSLQNLVGLLCSYEGIFIDRCSRCERVLSAEGHVPPVVRVWIDADKEGGRWDPRHVACR